MNGQPVKSQEGGGALERFNALAPSDAVAFLLPVCHSTAWAGQVARARPFARVAEVQHTAERVWRALSPADWREALDGHPRIGEGGGAAPEASQREQRGMAGASPQVRDAIAAGNWAYEQRFGHVFLIAAAGRSAPEILDSLTSRLRNDPDVELRLAAKEHEKITRLRLEGLLR